MSKKKIQLIFLGESGVGKSSIIDKVLELDYIKYKQIGTNNLASIELNYKDKDYEIFLRNIKGYENNKEYVKFILDTYDGCFVIFDLTDENSLNTINDWIQLIKFKKQNSIKIIILGNKKDLKNDRIQKDIIKNKLKEFDNITYLKVSAKDNINIKEAIERMIDLVEGNAIIGIKNKSCLCC